MKIRLLDSLYFWILILLSWLNHIWIFLELSCIYCAGWLCQQTWNSSWSYPSPYWYEPCHYKSLYILSCWMVYGWWAFFFFSFRVMFTFLLSLYEEWSIIQCFFRICDFSVFNVVDNDGNKIRDKEALDYIKRVRSCLPMFLYFILEKRCRSLF